jgi:hypothetical protein
VCSSDLIDAPGSDAPAPDASVDAAGLDAVVTIDASEPDAALDAFALPDCEPNTHDGFDGTWRNWYPYNDAVLSLEAGGLRITLRRPDLGDADDPGFDGGVGELYRFGGASNGAPVGGPDDELPWPGAERVVRLTIVDGTEVLRDCDDGSSCIASHCTDGSVCLGPSVGVHLGGDADYHFAMGLGTHRIRVPNLSTGGPGARHIFTSLAGGGVSLPDEGHYVILDDICVEQL